MIRWLRVWVMIVAAAVCGFLAVGALSNLWGLQDSPNWAYLALGGVWIALAVSFVILAMRDLRRLRRARGGC
jgi:nitric oxide reductase large subunit